MATPITGYVLCTAAVRINGGTYRCEGRVGHEGSHWNGLVRCEWPLEVDDA